MPPSLDHRPSSKRARQTSPERDSPASGPSANGVTSPTTESHNGGGGVGAQGSKVGQSSSFRNVSACNRCRLRKNRCDQKLPSCASCDKARVACVGYDPITKREIPRSYVFYLETRVEQLEALLRASNIHFPPAEDLEYCSRPGAETGPRKPTAEAGNPMLIDLTNRNGPSRPHNNVHDQPKPGKPVRQGNGSGNRWASTNGVSFARVVFAAVQSSMGEHRSSSDKAGIRPYKPIAGNGDAASGTSMRDSFFGLHTRPTINPAEFPEKEAALKLITLYFEHANPQIPVLHRGDFMQMFELAYATEDRIRGPRELYMLNMVFAIGGGIIMDCKSGGEEVKQAQPEEYHASAIVHLEACLSNSGGGLEELQAVLLLANFALLRPVPPGLWYIVGVAVRLAVDLGLHYEDGKDVDFGLTENMSSKERGRREYVRDMRRRLWWCTYSFDRLVSTCVGRPFGVSDQVVTTEFPSLLDDKYITPGGFSHPNPNGEPSYKIVAYHYFRLRLLQSEILQVLQYQQAQMARAIGQNNHNVYMHTDLSSPFLSRFRPPAFREWRINIDKRLFEWKNSAPTKEDSGVQFHTEFLELNYWQAIIMLYRQSLSVPAMFEGEYNTSKEVNSPSMYTSESEGDEERVYLKVAEAGQKIIRLYRSLHVMGLVNYTYLATHHLFMAGISYLYAIWHSPVVRSRLSNDEVDFTILAATSVFTELIDKCPPAEACRDAFDRTSKATVKMVSSKGGFGQPPPRVKRGSKNDRATDYISAREATINRNRQHQSRQSFDQSAARVASHYDMATPDGYASSHAASQLTPIQTNQFRLSMPGSIKTEDEYSMLRGMPVSDPVIPDNSAIDPSLLPSPGAAQDHSPASGASMTPVSANAPQLSQGGPAVGINFMQSPSGPYTPGQNLSYSDLQGMDFLQGLQSNSGIDGQQGGDAEMDLGFGLGWEGLHHDFSDGQQVDLFDGFFFGGQQGGGNAGMQ